MLRAQRAIVVRNLALVPKLQFGYAVLEAQASSRYEKRRRVRISGDFGANTVGACHAREAVTIDRNDRSRCLNTVTKYDQLRGKC